MDKGAKLRRRHLKNALYLPLDDFTLEDLLHASTGFTGRVDPPQPTYIKTKGGSPEEQLQYLRSRGFTVVSGPYK